MLKINNLTVTTLKGRTLLSGFSFVLNKHDKVALIGEEGNGKSTLLKILAGIDVNDYVTFTGQITSDGHAGYLPQHIPPEHENDIVSDYITGHREPDYSRLYRLMDIIAMDGDTLYQRRISSLSGGEKVRVSLARVLYDDPDILLLDEPTNDLDLETLVWLEQFIIQSDKAIIFISHDETMLENCATSILHLEQLKKKQEPKITFSSESYRDYHARRSHNIERNNQIARKEKDQLDRQMERYRQIYQKVEYRQDTISRGDPHGGRLLKKKMHSLQAQGRQLDRKKEELTQQFEPEEAISIFFEPFSVNPNRIVTDFHLDALYAGKKKLAENIDLFIRGRDRICIIGANGTGKTTLLRKLKEYLETRDNLSIAYMPQNYQEMLDYQLTAAAFLDGFCPDFSRTRSLLGALKFTTEEMNHRIEELSDGQKCKLLLASLVLQKPDVLLLDEPTRNLSPLSNPEIRKMLREYDGCIIAVSHDRLFIKEVADRVFRLTANGITPVV